VFQSYALFPHMSVLENLSFGLRARKAEEEEIVAIVRPLLEDYGLWHLRDVRAGKLSGGQRQRVAFLRALALRPSVYLFDEPLSALDCTIQESVRGGIRDIAASNGAPVLLVTHDLEDALELGDSIGVLDRGRMDFLGTADEVVQKDRCRSVRDVLQALRSVEALPTKGTSDRLDRQKSGGAVRAKRPSFLSDTLFPIRRP
jgi:ABC-type Fe3+/spermidine/putrescine transport system ATPase subunit